MATGRKPRKTAHEIRTPHTRYLQVANGATELGYKAGEVFGVNGHHVGTHKPCVHDLTEGKQQCAYCGSGFPLVFRGYLPVWDRDFTLRYVLICEDILESVDAIPFREQITMSRAKNKISPLIVRHERRLTRDLPVKEDWQKPIDMGPICCVLWKTPELYPFCVASTPTPTQKTVAVTDKGKPFSPMMQQAAKKNGAAVKPLDEEDVIAPLKNALERMKAVSPNGKH